MQSQIRSGPERIHCSTASYLEWIYALARTEWLHASTRIVDGREAH